MAALLKNQKKITRLCRVSGSYDLYRHIFRQSGLEVYMGMGKTGIPWVPWDSHGNGNKISHEMGMGIKCMGMGVNTRGWNGLL